MIFISAALAFSCAANAQSAPPSAAGAPKGSSDPARFTMHKQKLLDRIQARLQVLQKLQSCVQAANDGVAIKVCEQTAHEAMKKHAEK
jgi:hypothetical protein